MIMEPDGPGVPKGVAKALTTLCNPGLAGPPRSRSRQVGDSGQARFNYPHVAGTRPFPPYCCPEVSFLSWRLLKGSACGRRSAPEMAATSPEHTARLRGITGGL